MDKYITGLTIKKLREKNKLTQSELGRKLLVSDKTISKWETGKGYPDITLIEDIANIFKVSITELFQGDIIENDNISSNIEKIKFYVCPICGNVITSIGESCVSCHGINLISLEAEVADEKHCIEVSKIEDEYYVKVNHEMTKKHYISFIAALSKERMEFVKLYPESNAEARLKIRRVTKIYYYCNKDGLYLYNVI